MKRMFLTSAVVVLPFAADAADVSGQYSFLGEALPPATGVIGQVEVGLSPGATSTSTIWNRLTKPGSRTDGTGPTWRSPATGAPKAATTAVGLEAEVDASDALFGLQAMYNYHAYEPAAGAGDAQSAGLRRWIDYYLTPNTRLHGDISYWWYDFSESEAPSWSLTVGSTLEHRFGASPLSAFGSVQYPVSEFAGLDFKFI